MAGFFETKKIQMPRPEVAPPGRTEKMRVSQLHYVTGNPIQPPFPERLETAIFGFGCFWGAEKKLWQAKGVYSTAVGYAGGYTPNPTYQEVCTGLTGHNEVVMIVYDPKIVPYDHLLKIFWESHDPTQGMRQGNDIGTQYRSSIFTQTGKQQELAEESKKAYQTALNQSGKDKQISTEIREAPEFFYAEDYHQQYLAKNPQGYCGLGGTGIHYPSID